MPAGRRLARVGSGGLRRLSAASLGVRTLCASGLSSLLIHVGVFVGMGFMSARWGPADRPPKILLRRGEAVHQIAIVPYLPPPVVRKKLQTIEQVELPENDPIVLDEALEQELAEAIEEQMRPDDEFLSELRNRLPPPDFAEPPLAFEFDLPPVEQIETPPVALPERLFEPREKGIDRGVSVMQLPSPEYPQISRRRGEEGIVVLEVEVLPDGTVGRVRVIQQPRYWRLTDAAESAVRKAKFNPALHNGEPVAAVVIIPFRFELR